MLNTSVNVGNLDHCAT